MEPIDSDERSEDDIEAAALALGLVYNEELAKRAGGLLEADQVIQILSLKSLEEVRQAAEHKRLLAVQDGPVKRYPAFQFSAGQVHPGVIAILQAIPNTDGWCVLDYMFSLEKGVGTILPVDLIQMGPDGITKAVRFARRLEG